MGFASKLQAVAPIAAGAAAHYAGQGQKPPGQYPGQQSQGPYAGQPPAQSYGGHSPQPPHGSPYPPPAGSPYPPQPQGSPYGAPPPHGQAQYPYTPPAGAPPYGAPPGGGGPAADVGAFRNTLQQTIREQRLEVFYPPQNQQAVDNIARKAAASVDALCAAWRLPREVAVDMCKLGLYDIVLYVDDSGSMAFEEQGERIKDLNEALRRVSYAATLFDDDGISVRFMNSHPPSSVADGVRSDGQVESLMRNIKFTGLTPMGTELKAKVMDPMVVGPARNGQLRKPVLVIVLTDGQPAGEKESAVFDVIKGANKELQRTQYGAGAVAFQFAQLGNDKHATQFLAKLDSEPTVGGLVDCTSNYENESAEMARANPPVDLTPELWLVKLLLGAIDHSYDRKDEKGASGGHPGAGGQQQYQNPYSAQQPTYAGASPQQQQYGGGYGQPQAPSGWGGYPQQQQYAQQGQQGQPQYAPPQQQQYGGYPPQGGQYPPQGGQYPPQGGQQGGYPQQQQYAPPGGGPPRY